MIILGDIRSIPVYFKGDLLVYNLSGMAEGYQRIDILPPVNQINYSDERQFDIFFSQFIFNNDNIFYEFFSKILYPVYSGYDVYLIVTRNPFFDMISESLLKLIQQRYGYNGAIVNNAVDIDYLNPDETFTTAGIYNFDMDKQRFTGQWITRNSQYVTSEGEVKQGAEFI